VITEQGVRRCGFHGLSYEYIAGALPNLEPRAAAGRVVVAHLGNGASMCALKGGRSVASTMGLTPVDGLPMGTRCGSLDPGVVLYLMDKLGMDARAVEKLIYQKSGLLGVSGLSSDMRVLLASDAPGARRAVDLFVYRIRRELGSLTAAQDPPLTIWPRPPTMSAVKRASTVGNAERAASLNSCCRSVRTERH